jgi:hypothetical protein
MTQPETPSPTSETLAPIDGLVVSGLAELALAASSVGRTPWRSPSPIALGPSAPDQSRGCAHRLRFRNRLSLGSS